MTSIDATDRAILEATQSGLPITRHPYAALAGDLGIHEAEIIKRFERLIGIGVIRRIAVAPNHFALGMTANGMTVWDIADDVISEIGGEIGAIEYVSHCYQRPRALPDWPYNLFAMVHGTTRAEVERKRREIALLIGPACRASDILYSTRILKKTGVRFSRQGG